ncbi:MAG TPA: MOSC domain-containing protein [Azoarcus taiwanensis]|nr:MOSC domain-containing protein [Azoarcus taiwanensis]
MTLTLSAIARYPIKGLSAEVLPRVELGVGCGLPDDRRWAMAHGAAVIDPDAPRWMPKRAFLALDSLPSLASLSLRRAGEGEVFEFVCEGRVLLRADLGCGEGRKAVEALIADQAGDAARGRVSLVEGRGFAFCDAEPPLVSIACLASLHDVSEAVGRPVEVERFRANLLVAGGLPWQELDWVGQEIHVGEARLRVLEPILRCAATRANPRSGEADLDLLRPLIRLTGDAVFGVYAEVVAGGSIAPGDPVLAPRGGRLPARHGLGLT